MTDSNSQVEKHVQRIRQLAEQRQRVLSMPAEKALAAILEHPQPAALVHSFPEEDLFFLIQDIGTDYALPLITLTSPPGRYDENLMFAAPSMLAELLLFPALGLWLFRTQAGTRSGAR